MPRRIKADLETIVGFATDARQREEQGSQQMWGRVAGFPSAAKTVEWAAAEFRRAGIGDVRVQPIAQDARASFWMPLSWEVRLLADPAFGDGHDRRRAALGPAAVARRASPAER